MTINKYINTGGSSTSTFTFTANNTQTWSDAITISRTSNTVCTFECTSSAIATITANRIVGSIVRWLDYGSAQKQGFINHATASGTTVTCTLYGSIVEATDSLTSFRFAIFDRVRILEFFIYDEVLLDATNFQGRQFYLPANIDYRILAYDVVLGTAAAGTGAAFACDIFDDGTGITTTDIDLLTNASSLNIAGDANKLVIAGGSTLEVRVTASAGATNKGKNCKVNAYYCFDDIFDSI